MGESRNHMTRRSFLCVLAAGVVTCSLLPALSGCSDDGRSVTGTWYGVDDEGSTSTLEINEDGTWLFNGRYSASGDWSETDGGTIVLSATLVSIPFTLEGEGDGRVLAFAGEDPSRGNAPEISRTTFYATEAARESAQSE